MNRGARDDDARGVQVRIFRDLLARLEGGEPPVPTDVVAPLIDELEQRIDERAVDEAWAEEGAQGYSRDSSQGRSRVTPVRRSVALLKRAERDLQGLEAAEREAVSKAIQALSDDPAPRSVRGLHGGDDRHVLQRVGRFRLLYSLRDDVVLIVAVTAGPV